jgi:hypothetical protein
MFDSIANFQAGLPESQDGGGIRSYSSLLILKTLLEMVQDANKNNPNTKKATGLFSLAYIWMDRG